MQRRTLLKAGGAAAALAALPLSLLFRRREPLSKALVPDPARILDLPRGFSYRVLSESGQTMSDGYRVPGLPDGMACFAGPADTHVLMRNHEVGRYLGQGAIRPNQTAPSEAYDAGAHGGVTRVVLDARTGELRSQNLVLTGTVRNCAGGSSPWGWLSCEETTEDGHGYVFLCRTHHARVAKPERIDGYGRYNHEAVAIDPTTHVAYLTEDRGDSCLYRFVPKDPARPFVGQLSALKIRDDDRFDLARGLAVGEARDVVWVDIPEPNPADDSVRHQGQERGAAVLRRGEGIAAHGGHIYVCSTTGGKNGSGQIFKLTPHAQGGRLELLAESRDELALDCPDNICVAPWGDVLMCEDGAGDQYLRGLTPSGTVYDIARNAKSGGEFAGVCLAPDAKRLFVNLQHEGLTLAIEGPFESLRHGPAHAV